MVPPLLGPVKAAKGEGPLRQPALLGVPAGRCQRDGGARYHRGNRQSVAAGGRRRHLGRGVSINVQLDDAADSGRARRGRGCGCGGGCGRRRGRGRGRGRGGRQHLRHIQVDAVGSAQPSYQILHAGAVEVGALDRVGAGVDPVHLVGGTAGTRRVSRSQSEQRQGQEKSRNDN